jgi:N-acetylmuramoyl-L-alanine amidase
MHYTATTNEASLKILSGQDPQTRVSVHYLITDEVEPQIIPIVPEDTVAFHAGVSHWRGLNDLNETSIGIEVVNLDGNQHPYSEAQFAAIASLSADIVRRYKILPQNVVAHSDIAPNRKLDPGILFPWRRLEREAGVGCYPDPSDVAERLRSPALPRLSIQDIQRALTRWGYLVPSTGKLDETTRHALSAFQRHYRPSKVDGQPDRETIATLWVLLEQTGL